MLRSNHFYAFYCVFLFSCLHFTTMHTGIHVWKVLTSSLLLSFSSLLFIYFIYFILLWFFFTAHSRTPPRTLRRLPSDEKMSTFSIKLNFLFHTLSRYRCEIYLLFILCLLCYPSRVGRRTFLAIRFSRFNPNCAKNYSLLFVFCFYIIWRGWLDSPQ